MPTLDVCPKCRKVCAKCHGDVHNGHALIVCRDCKDEYAGKCYVCRGKRKGPGTDGAVGPGSVCNKCFKSPFKCIICGGKGN